MTAAAPGLPLWKGAAVRLQPRDKNGRFMRVEHSPARRLILKTARDMRVQMGLPADPRLGISS